MKSYTITVNGNVYDVTVEENGAVSAPAAAPRRAAAPAPAAAPKAATPAGGAGNVKIEAGAAGKVFSEIREITGTSAATGNYSTLGYPSGYTRENTRILSAEINYNGTNWNTLGMFNVAADHSVGCSLSSSGINISYPEVAAYQNKAIRILLIKVQ